MSSPIKANLKTEWLALTFIVLGFLAAGYFYQNFPAQVATHWNFQGEVDGYSSPFVAAFLFPILMLIMYLVFLILPYFDPKKEQYATFAPVYHQFKNIFLIFIFIIFLLTGINGLGYYVNIGLLMPLLVGGLFMLIGNLIKKVKMNWFMGIRTPWTLSSETVWRKTHELSSKVMIISGLLMIATLIMSPTGKLILFSLAILLIVFVPIIYSYLLYRQEKNNHN